MKHRSTAAQFTLFAFLLTAISAPAQTSRRSAPGVVANGRRIFNQSCSACHDTVGATQKSAPELKNYYHRQAHPDDAAVRAIIQQGRGKMPGFSTLNPSQLNDLVAYLKTL